MHLSATAHLVCCFAPIGERLRVWGITRRQVRADLCPFGYHKATARLGRTGLWLFSRLEGPYKHLGALASSCRAKGGFAMGKELSQTQVASGRLVLRASCVERQSSRDAMKFMRAPARRSSGTIHFIVRGHQHG